MNQKIAIIYLGDYRFDGRCVNMINSLIKNYSISIFHVKKNNNNKGNIISKNLTEFKLNPSKQKFIKYIHWTLIISRFLKKHHFQKIICSDLYSLFPACLIKKKHTIIYDSREIFTELAAHYNHKLKKTIIYHLESFCMSKVDIVLTSAETDTLFLQKKYSSYKKIKYHTLYNFPPPITIKNKSNYLREKLNIPPSNLILIYQGVLQKGRGLKQMIAIIKNMDNAVGVILGDGEEQENLKKHVIKHSLKEKIYFIQSVPYLQLFKITCSADIGLALIRPLGVSYKYALPNKLFEYAMCGIPCLASNLPNMKKYIEKYNLGLCIGPRLPDQIKAINKLALPENQQISFNNRMKHSLNWESQNSQFQKIICN